MAATPMWVHPLLNNSVADLTVGSQVQVAQNLPISNTGRVNLLISPTSGDVKADIVLEVDKSTLLVPGDYQVTPVPGPPIVVFPIAQISYDTTLQNFSVNVLPERGIPFEAQFSILVNLSNLGVPAKEWEFDIHS